MVCVARSSSCHNVAFLVLPELSSTPKAHSIYSGSDTVRTFSGGTNVATRMDPSECERMPAVVDSGTRDPSASDCQKSSTRQMTIQ